MTQLGQMIYQDGILKGREEGREEGREKGREEGKIKVAKALLDIMSDEAIAKRAELPLVLVKELRKESLVKLEQ